MKKIALLAIFSFVAVESKIETITPQQVPVLRSFDAVMLSIPYVHDVYLRKVVLLQVRQFYTNSVYLNTLFAIQSEEEALQYVRTVILPFWMIAVDEIDENFPTRLEIEQVIMADWQVAHTNPEVKKCFKDVVDTFEPAYDAIQNISLLECWKNRSVFEIIARDVMEQKKSREKCNECQSLLSAYKK